MSEQEGGGGRLGRLFSVLRGRMTDVPPSQPSLPETSDQLKQKFVGIIETYAKGITDGTREFSYGRAMDTSRSYLKTKVDFRNVQAVFDARKELLEASRTQFEQIKTFVGKNDAAEHIIHRMEGGGFSLIPTEDDLKKSLGMFLIKTFTADSPATVHFGHENIFFEKAQEEGRSQVAQALIESVPDLDLQTRANEWLSIRTKVDKLDNKYPERQTGPQYNPVWVRDWPDNAKERFNSLEQQSSAYLRTLAEDFIEAQQTASASSNSKSLA